LKFLLNSSTSCSWRSSRSRASAGRSNVSPDRRVGPEASGRNAWTWDSSDPSHNGRENSRIRAKPDPCGAPQGKKAVRLGSDLSCTGVDNQAAGTRSRPVSALTAANNGSSYVSVTRTLRLVGTTSDDQLDRTASSGVADYGRRPDRSKGTFRPLRRWIRKDWSSSRCETP
jgi:hypothetical protein